MKNIICSFTDYVKTRKRLGMKYFISLIPALIFLFFTFIFNVGSEFDINEVFISFVNTQISFIAILISFSIAIITILVSSESSNIRQLKNTDASEKNFHCLNIGGQSKRLNLFQVILSTITYNIFLDILYFTILIIQIFLRLIVPIYIIKYLVYINIFFISHILLIMFELIAQMYFTFWSNKK